MTPIRRSSESLPMLLLRARETVMSRFRPILQDSSLTEQQFRVLRALNEMGELTAIGLANECVILAPSMTRILRKLSSDGLITVRKSGADKRVLRIRLAAKGVRRLEKVAPKFEEQYALIKKELRDEGLHVLYEHLRDLIRLGESRRPSD